MLLLFSLPSPHPTPQHISIIHTHAARRLQQTLCFEGAAAATTRARASIQKDDAVKKVGLPRMRPINDFRLSHILWRGVMCRVCTCSHPVRPRRRVLPNSDDDAATNKHQTSSPNTLASIIDSQLPVRARAIMQHFRVFATRLFIFRLFCFNARCLLHHAMHDDAHTATTQHQHIRNATERARARVRRRWRATARTPAHR